MRALLLGIILLSACRTTPRQRDPGLVCDVYGADVANHTGLDIEIVTSSRIRREVVLGYLASGENRTFTLPAGSMGVWARQPGGAYLRLAHHQRVDVKYKCVE